MKMANSWCWRNDRRKTMNPVGGVGTRPTAVKHRTAPSLSLVFHDCLLLDEPSLSNFYREIELCSHNHCGKIQTQDHEMSTNTDPQNTRFSVFSKLYVHLRTVYI